LEGQLGAKRKNWDFLLNLGLPFLETRGHYLIRVFKRKGDFLTLAFTGIRKLKLEGGRRKAWYTIIGFKRRPLGH